MFNYYLKDQLGLTSAYNGIIKAVVGFVSFLFNMTLCLWIIRKADTGKSTVVLVGACTLASLGTVFAPQISVFLSCGIALYAGYSVSVPVLQDMVATRADPAQKNLVMGFYNATKSLGSIIGSLLAGFLYAIHVKLPFVLIAVVYRALRRRRGGVSGILPGRRAGQVLRKPITLGALPFFRGDTLYS